MKKHDRDANRADDLSTYYGKLLSGQYDCQFSTARPSTRKNSPLFAVATVKPFDRAMAPIWKS